MERSSPVHKDATIYHYQLIRKIHIQSELIISYAFIAFLYAGVQFLLYRYEGMLSWALGLISVVLLHWLILRMTMLRVDKPEERRWGWRFKLPWSGYLPIQYVEHRLFRRLHRHLLWLGMCIIAISYPWAPESMMISMISWHFWLLAPRIIILHLIRKARRDGVLLLNESIVSFYHR